MKKIIPLSWMFLLFSLLSFSQTTKWYFAVGSGYCFGGPASSIKKQMKNAGWYDTQNSLFGTIHYPLKEISLPLILSAGKKLKEYKGIFFTAGLADKATVEGAKRVGRGGGVIMFLINWGDDYFRNYISVDYEVWQIAGGYQYDFPNTRLKLGFGPSLLLFNSKATKEDRSTNKHNSLLPALVGNARLPLGREKRQFGIELFIQTALAPPVKMEDFTKVGASDKVSIGMCNFTLGLAMALRS